MGSAIRNLIVWVREYVLYSKSAVTAEKLFI